MTAIDAAQHPFRPALDEQLPDSSCKIHKDGKTYELGAESCTACAAGRIVARVTGGKKNPTGCVIRRLTEPLDVTGGLMLRQVADVVRKHFGITMLVFTGAKVVRPEFLARQIRAGRPAIVQGNTAAFLGTPYKVTGGDVNHAEAWLEVRGGTLDHPDEVLVYDSCADGRRDDIDQGPTWVPWTLGLRFCAYLRPSGPGTARLGPGKVYCAIGPDTEPHVRLLPGAERARPFPDRARAGLARTPVHSAPERGRPTTTRYIAKGTLVRLYQYVRGDSYKGSDLWGANDDGTEFIHLANVTHEGGGT